MKRVIGFNQGIIGGDDAYRIIDILPQLGISFRQRKTYFEYYFDNTEVDLSLEDIDKISNAFTVKLDYEELIVNV